MSNVSEIESPIKQVATELEIPVDLVDDVIRFKWKSVHKAQNLYQSIEDSGLGKFTIRSKVVIRRIEKNKKMLSNLLIKIEKELNESKKIKLIEMLNKLEDDIKFLEGKI